MKTLQAHALMQAMHGGEYICDFEMGAKVDGIINAVSSLLSRALGKNAEGGSKSCLTT